MGSSGQGGGQIADYRGAVAADRAGVGLLEHREAAAAVELGIAHGGQDWPAAAGFDRAAVQVGGQACRVEALESFGQALVEGGGAPQSEKAAARRL